jgi:hypothetical protein
VSSCSSGIPIGVREEKGAEDEYDSYAPPIARMAMAHTTAAEIATHLIGLQAELGVSSSDTRERAERGAARRLRWHARRRD